MRKAEKDSRKIRASQARAAIPHRGKGEIGISGAEIARYLGVDTSSINRVLARMEDLEESAPK